MPHLTNFFRRNELLIKLLSVFFIGTILVGAVVAFTSIKVAEKAYVASYKDTNELLLNQINEDYERLNDSIANVLQRLKYHPAAKKFMKDDIPSELESNVVIYDMKQQILETNLLHDNISSNLVVLGTNGNTHYQSQGKPVYTSDELLAQPYIKKASENPTSIVYHYTKEGYSSATNGKPSLIVVKALYDQDAIYGYVLMTLLESEFAKYYTTLLDPNINHLWVVNEENTVVSSNQKYDLGKTLEQVEKQKIGMSSPNIEAMEEKKLYSFNYSLYNRIDERLVAQRMVLYPTVIYVSVIIVLIVSVIAFLTLKKTTSPIYELTHKIPAIIKGDFSQEITVRGTYEIQELLRSYNFMLRGLNGHIDELLIKEEEKRLLEFRALQLRIQPHFIYNTLTVIKFQVMQEKNEEAITSLDAFIRLLRNLIGTEDEFIPLEEEIKNLEDYIHILKIRFGTSIQTTVHVSTDTTLSVPKLLIQPFVENAFIHAFPTDIKHGRIDVFINTVGEKLVIDVLDNGVGFGGEEQQEGQAIMSSKHHFSGIGISNVEARLALIYGEQAKVTVTSQLGKGTLVRLEIPLDEDGGLKRQSGM